MEKTIRIDSGDMELEAAINEKSPDKAGVVCHPHSLYGGSMHNNVVDAGMEALAQAGWTGLRFNFRGVGGSSGSFDQGIGEQQDVVAAAAYLKEKGARDIVVIGYSFGSWVSAFGWPGLEALGVHPLILVAPPAAFMSFNGLPPETRIGMMICGEQDDIAPPDLAVEVGAGLSDPVEPVVIDGANHFFGGYESRISELIVSALGRIR